MANRKTSFAVGEYYHLYNRGVDKRIIFEDEHDIQRFLKSMLEFNTVDPIGSLYEHSFVKLGGETPKSQTSLVDIIAYCLNPNHFHLILREVSEGGISEFMKRLSGGYTGYFNQKHKRSGALFQGVFKSVHVAANGYLVHLSAYVNLNDRVHQLGGETPKLVKSLSSWEEYVNKEASGFCKKGIILEQFQDVEEYKNYALASLDVSRNKKEGMKDLQELLLE
jgi:putative transposase